MTPIPKQSPIRSKTIRNAARGEMCTLRVAGVCSEDRSTTVLAHLPDESHGMGRKSDDISACFACRACHDWLDGRTKTEWHTPELREWHLRRAMVRTWRRLIELGVVEVKP